MRNKKGPNIQPRGTPQIVLLILETQPAIITKYFLSLSEEEKQLLLVL